MLAKAEIGGNIILLELMTIMENFGLHENETGEEQESNPSPPKKKKGEVDLGKLDNESIEIMAMLMVFCIRNDVTAAEVFESKSFE